MLEGEGGVIKLPRVLYARTQHRPQADQPQTPALDGPKANLRNRESAAPKEGHRNDARLEPRRSSTFRNSTVSVLTATTSIHATGAGITAAAGTRLALRLILHAEFGYHPLQSRLSGNRYRRPAAARCCINNKCVAIVQFARLLPALAVVAVSQAASPESNPNSPLPMNATVVT